MEQIINHWMCVLQLLIYPIYRMLQRIMLRVAMRLRIRVAHDIDLREGEFGRIVQSQRGGRLLLLPRHSRRHLLAMFVRFCSPMLKLYTHIQTIQKSCIRTLVVHRHSWRPPPGCCWQSRCEGWPCSCWRSCVDGASSSDVIAPLEF